MHNFNLTFSSHITIKTSGTRPQIYEHIHTYKRNTYIHAYIYTIYIHHRCRGGKNVEDAKTIFPELTVNHKSTSNYNAFTAVNSFG